MSKYDKLVEFYKTKLNSIVAESDWFKVDQELIDRFAEVTGDKQWIHTDPMRAKKESPYKKTIAHGFLTLSLIPYLTKSNKEEFFEKNYPGMKYRVNYGLNKVRFPAPVKEGSYIKAKLIPISIENLGDSAEIVYKIIVNIKGEEKPAMVAEQVFRLFA